MRRNPVKERLAAGGTVAGVLVFEFAGTTMARLTANAGADFVLFDQEHTGWSLDRIGPLLAAARAADVVPLVRVPGTQYHLLAPALDAGALGVMVPMVESAEQARLVVESTKYPPLGRRGVGLYHADDLEPGGLPETLQRANAETIVLAQIETVAGLEAADEIAAVEGVDVLWIGHFDLTASMGIPGEFEHERFTGAVAHLLEVCGRRGKALGMMVGSPEDGRRILDQGFRAVGFGDVFLYGSALSAGLAGLRG